MLTADAASIRPYESTDARATRDVFLRAVRVTASTDYTPAQLAAWAPSDVDLDAWAVKRGSAGTVVATVNDRVVGFTDCDDDGYIDMMFVDPDVARRGVASALLEHLRARAISRGVLALTTHASVTARAFFEAHGFTVTATRRPVVRGVQLTNFAMRCPLAGSAPVSVLDR